MRYWQLLISGQGEKKSHHIIIKQKFCVKNIVGVRNVSSRSPRPKLHKIQMTYKLKIVYVLWGFLFEDNKGLLQ